MQFTRKCRVGNAATAKQLKQKLRQLESKDKILHLEKDHKLYRTQKVTIAFATEFNVQYMYCDSKGIDRRILLSHNQRSEPLIKIEDGNGILDFSEGKSYGITTQNVLQEFKDLAEIIAKGDCRLEGGNSSEGDIAIFVGLLMLRCYLGSDLTVVFRSQLGMLAFKYLLKYCIASDSYDSVVKFTDATIEYFFNSFISKYESFDQASLDSIEEELLEEIGRLLFRLSIKRLESIVNGSNSTIASSLRNLVLKTTYGYYLNYAIPRFARGTILNSAHVLTMGKGGQRRRLYRMGIATFYIYNAIVAAYFLVFGRYQNLFLIFPVGIILLFGIIKKGLGIAPFFLQLFTTPLFGIVTFLSLDPLWFQSTNQKYYLNAAIVLALVNLAYVTIERANFRLLLDEYRSDFRTAISSLLRTALLFLLSILSSLLITLSLTQSSIYDILVGPLHLTGNSVSRSNDIWAMLFLSMVGLSIGTFLQGIWNDQTLTSTFAHRRWSR